MDEEKHLEKEIFFSSIPIGERIEVTEDMIQEWVSQLPSGMSIEGYKIVGSSLLIHGNLDVGVSMYDFERSFEVFCLQLMLKQRESGYLAIFHRLKKKFREIFIDLFA